MDILTHPFVLGFLIGCGLALYVLITGYCKQNALKKEIANLQKHVVTSMDTHTANVEKIKQLEELVNNQKVTIQILKEKLSQRDLRELRQYAEACAMMVKNAPGFAQAWQNCLNEIAQKEEDENIGKIVFVKPLQRLLGLFSKTKIENQENTSGSEAEVMNK